MAMNARDSKKGKLRLEWRRLLWGAAALVVGFLAVALIFDERMSRALGGWPAGERAFFSWITQFGEGAVVLVPALVLWIAGLIGWRLLRPYWWRWSCRAVSAMSLFTFGAVGIPGLIAAILKRLFGRARPIWLETEGVFSFQLFKPFAWDFQSFPSGHATTSLAFALTMTLLFGKKGMWVFVPAALIALSRVVIQMHYLSDSLFGAMLGMSLAWIMAGHWRSRGWIFVPGDGWRNRLAPIIVRQWRGLSRRWQRDSAQARRQGRP